MSHKYSAGDILVASWGYGQTNVNFYEVVKTTATMVHLRRIEYEMATHRPEHMVGTCVPARPLKSDKHRPEVFRKKVQDDGRVKIEDWITAWEWDGSDMSFSYYA